MSKKCIICGCGGIGSYFAAHIERLIELKQIVDFDFEFYDDDIVEYKNMLYQNFESGDLDMLKTEALSFKYFNMTFINKRLVEEDLKDCGLVILCADNNIIREEAYNNFINNKIPFIDSRANGKTVGIFSSDTEDYLKTISSSKESSSCQNPFQLVNKEIEYGNVVIASILAQTILNYSRRKKLPTDLLLNI